MTLHNPVKPFRIYYMKSLDMGDLALDMTPLINMNLPAAPILWDHWGAYAIIPKQHVEDIVEAVRRQRKQGKKGWLLDHIEWNDAIPIDYKLAQLLLSERIRDNDLYAGDTDGK